MKINYIFILLALPFLSFSQSIEIGAGAGTGAYYFFEDIDSNVDIDYRYAASIYVDAKHNFKDRWDGVKLRMQNTSVDVIGEDYRERFEIDGSVETFTISLMYERLKADKKFNLGYNFGAGHTLQTLDRFKYQSGLEVTDRFMSLNGAGVFSFRMNKALRLRAETGLLWTDPINTFRGSANWNTAGEDLSLLFQVGVTYSFLKSND